VSLTDGEEFFPLGLSTPCHATKNKTYKYNENLQIYNNSSDSVRHRSQEYRKKIRLVKIKVTD
jgi:hypothetical protein